MAALVLPQAPVILRGQHPTHHKSNLVRYLIIGFRQRPLQLHVKLPQQHGPDGLNLKVGKLLYRRTKTSACAHISPSTAHRHQSSKTKQNRDKNCVPPMQPWRPAPKPIKARGCFSSERGGAKRSGSYISASLKALSTRCDSAGDTKIVSPCTDYSEQSMIP